MNTILAGAAPTTAFKSLAALLYMPAASLLPAPLSAQDHSATRSTTPLNGAGSLPGHINYNPNLGLNFSRAGFYNDKQFSSRQAHCINSGWYYKKAPLKADVPWQKVNLPHGIDNLALDASGSQNFQGVVSYKKTLKLNSPQSRHELYFEAIMGKCKIYVDGKLMKEHFGGFLPVIVDLSTLAYKQDGYVIELEVDNSNDASYPPGKEQQVLDFCYFGGIYRDVYLVQKPQIAISEAMSANKVAGGGVYFYTKSANERQAECGARVHVENRGNSPVNLEVNVKLYALHSDREVASFTSEQQTLAEGKDATFELNWIMQNPRLWSPQNPNLYAMQVSVCHVSQHNGKREVVVVDKHTSKVGVRSFYMNAKQGLVLNGKPYEQKLLGGNRHQDFALLGNAVPNNLQWRDAYKMKQAGMTVVRSAHYPLDPAFMDACDELGLFVIVATPGWQFWNKQEQFAQRVLQDVRHMIRRDRNRPSVFLWEPILNETHYPHEFAKQAYEATKQEMPFGSCYAACDGGEPSSELYDVIYSHPLNGNPAEKTMPDKLKDKAVFTREFGDNVDDWNSQNSPSRVARSWGEAAMLTQALHYLNPPYQYTSLTSLQNSEKRHLGGCLWHTFDHQRGYHPDPFFGGIFDAYRQPKTSFMAFAVQAPLQIQGFAQIEKSSGANSQTSPVSDGNINNQQLLSTLSFGGPQVYIAHAMTPVSPQDVWVFSNMQQVEFRQAQDAPLLKAERDANNAALGQAFKFPAIGHMHDKALARKNQHALSYYSAKATSLLAGQNAGTLTAEHRVDPARRVAKLELHVDQVAALQANGSDVAPIVVQMFDEQGRIKRLTRQKVKLQLQGDAEFVGSPDGKTLELELDWGSAVALLRCGTKAGKIKLTAAAAVDMAAGFQPASLELELLESAEKYLLAGAEGKQVKAGESEPGKAEQEQQPPAAKTSASPESNAALQQRVRELESRLQQYKLKEVEQDQKRFE